MCQWGECQTRGQPFTGAMQTGLAEALWLRVCRGDEAEESDERLFEANTLAVARNSTSNGQLETVTAICYSGSYTMGTPHLTWSLSTVATGTAQL